MDTKNYEIILTDTAKEELSNIYKYISENLYEEMTANRLMNKIEENILRLKQNPYSCVKVSVRPHKEIYRRLVIDNFIALYDVEEKYSQVIIYRVLNSKMDYLDIIDDEL